MSESEQATDSAVIRVAFDTCVLVDWHKKSLDKTDELKALAEIFRMKLSADASRWHFIYLDAVRREVVGVRLDRLERESEIEDILPCFDEKISLSKLPFNFPVTFIGKKHGEAIEKFQAMSVSKSDSIVLADAAYLGASLLVRQPHLAS